MLRSFVICMILISAIPLATKAEPPVKPTPDQEKEVKAAVKALGGGYHAYGSGSNGQDDSPKPNVFVQRLGNDELKKLPPIPFPFRIVLGKKATNESVKLLLRFPTLAGVRLDGSAITGAGLAELSALPLETVEINVTGFSDKDLAAIGKLSALKRLYLTDTAVTDAGLETLAGRGLTELTIPERARTDRGLKHVLAAMSSPTDLDLTGWSITDASLAGIAEIKTLERLRLDKTPVTDAGVKALTGMKALRELSLAGTRVTDAALPALDKLPALRTLNLLNTKVTAAGVGSLKDHRLDELLLPDAAKTDAGLKNYLAAVRPREILDLFLGWDLTDAGIEAILAWPDLKRLDLGRHTLTDAGAKQLARLKNLEWFNPFEAKGLTPVGIAQLASLPKLRLLNLNGATVNEAAMKALGQCAKLEYLYLDRTAVTDADLKHLASVSTLTNLSLTNTAVSEVGLKSLSDLPKLRQIVLFGNPRMSDAGLRASRDALPKCEIFVPGDLRGK